MRAEANLRPLAEAETFGRWRRQEKYPHETRVKRYGDSPLEQGSASPQRPLALA